MSGDDLYFNDEKINRNDNQCDETLYKAQGNAWIVKIYDEDETKANEKMKYVKGNNKNRKITWQIDNNSNKLYVSTIKRANKVG